MIAVYIADAFLCACVIYLSDDIAITPYVVSDQGAIGLGFADQFSILVIMIEGGALAGLFSGSLAVGVVGGDALVVFIQFIQSAYVVVF